MTSPVEGDQSRCVTRRTYASKSNAGEWSASWHARHAVSVTPGVRSGRSDVQLQEWLDDDRLVTTGPTGRAIVRWNALHALAEVLEPQVGQKGEESYQTLARRYRRKAAALLPTIAAEVDTTDPADGQGDVVIDLGTVDTLRG